MIELGGADILVAFEQMEALRWLQYLKPGGKVIVNDQKIKPMPVVSGKVEYPRILEDLKSKADTAVWTRAPGRKPWAIPRWRTSCSWGPRSNPWGCKA